LKENTKKKREPNPKIHLHLKQLPPPTPDFFFFFLPPAISAPDLHCRHTHVNLSRPQLPHTRPNQPSSFPHFHSSLSPGLQNRPPPFARPSTPLTSSDFPLHTHKPESIKVAASRLTQESHLHRFHLLLPAAVSPPQHSQHPLHLPQPAFSCNPRTTAPTDVVPFLTHQLSLAQTGLLPASSLQQRPQTQQPPATARTQRHLQISSHPSSFCQLPEAEGKTKKTYRRADLQ